MNIKYLKYECFMIIESYKTFLNKKYVVLTSLNKIYNLTEQIQKYKNL